MQESNKNYTVELDPYINKTDSSIIRKDINI